jgi:hypothetical protein
VTEPPTGLPESERAQWVCESNYVTCQHHHLWRIVDSGFILDQRRVDGHIFFGCRKCEPTTYFFAVVTSRPSPTVTCYAISQAQYRYWNESTADRLPTPEMLYHLGYNARWRAPRV